MDDVDILKQEFYLGREMPTVDGSTDPDDFSHALGTFNQLPPKLYPAIEYPTRSPITVTGGLVTVLIKKQKYAVKPVLFKVRARDLWEEYWNATPEGLLYQTDPEVWEDVEFNLTGDIGQWSGMVSGFFAKGACATGGESVGGYSVPAGSVGIEAVGAGEIFSLARLTAPTKVLNAEITQFVITFDFFDPLESGGGGEVEISWEIGTYGEPDFDYGSSEFTLYHCTAGENVIDIDTIPTGATINATICFLSISDTIFVASIASIILR